MESVTRLVTHMWLIILTQHNEVEAKFSTGVVRFQTVVPPGISDLHPHDVQMTATGARVKSHTDERLQIRMNRVAIIDHVHLLVMWVVKMPVNSYSRVRTAAESD